MIIRVLVALAGFGLLGWGGWLLITTVPVRSLLQLAVWLVAALVLHDIVWSPTLLGIGAASSRVPSRARRYLQAGLVVAGSLLVVAVPLLLARGRQPVSTTILVQDVAANLLLLLAVVAAVAVVAWLLRVLRDRRHAGD